MAKRYSRRRPDGTVEYYDNQKEAEAARREDFYDGIAGTFALGGLVVGGILAYGCIYFFGLSGWPKVAQFALVIGGAFACSIISTFLSKILYWILITTISLGVLYGVGALIWALL